MLNCSIDISELNHYSLVWNISNKKGQQIEKLNFPQVTPTRNFANLSLLIEKAKIVDNGIYNCSITRTLPPPSKSFFGPLIQLLVQGKINV